MVSVSEALFRTAAIFSSLLSGFVVLTGLVFPTIMLNKVRPFSYIIFFISLCDFFGSISYTFGFPLDGTVLCSVQSILSHYFFPVSWLWTTMLVFHLRCVLIHKKIRISLSSAHLICWITPIFQLILPLSSNNNFGSDDKLNGVLPCNYNGDEFSKGLWILIAFNGLLYSCVFLMIYWTAEIYSYLKTNQDYFYNNNNNRKNPQEIMCTNNNYLNEKALINPTDEDNKNNNYENNDVQTHNREYSLFKVTIIYPIGMLVTWFPAMITYAIFYISQNRFVPRLVWLFVLACSTQYGAILALIFLTKSKIAQISWKKL
eukprot:gene19012-26926_t